MADDGDSEMSNQNKIHAEQLSSSEGAPRLSSGFGNMRAWRLMVYVSMGVSWLNLLTAVSFKML